MKIDEQPLMCMCEELPQLFCEEVEIDYVYLYPKTLTFFDFYTTLLSMRDRKFASRLFDQNGYDLLPF